MSSMEAVSRAHNDLAPKTAISIVRPYQHWHSCQFQSLRALGRFGEKNIYHRHTSYHSAREPPSRIVEHSSMA